MQLQLRSTFLATLSATFCSLLRLSIFALFSLSFQGCAHSYHYTAEVGGEGAMFAKHGVIYLIPAPKDMSEDSDDTLFKMKLTSLGVKDQMLHVRLYFIRKAKAPNAKESAFQFLDPREQTLILPDSGTEIHPGRVYASTTKKPLIALDQKPKQAVELLFPVGDQKDSDIQHFLLRWKVHYAKNKSEGQTARFDRDDRAPQQGAEINPGDPDYPYDESPLFPAGSEWIPDGWAWW